MATPKSKTTNFAIYQPEPERVEKIKTYTDGQKPVPNMTATVIVKGEKIDDWDVYEIPRDEIRLNPENHRFHENVYIYTAIIGI